MQVHVWFLLKVILPRHLKESSNSKHIEQFKDYRLIVLRCHGCLSISKRHIWLKRFCCAELQVELIRYVMCVVAAVYFRVQRQVNQITPFTGLQKQIKSTIYACRISG